MTLLILAFAVPGQAERGKKAVLSAATSPVPIYVEEWKIAPDIRLSGRALEVALCVHLMKDKRVEGQCAGDVQEILHFSADSALAGNQSQAVEQLVARVQKSRWLLQGEVSPLPNGKWHVLLQAFEKDAASVGVVLVAGAHVATVEMEIGPEQQAQVLTLIPGLSDQLLDKLLGPAGLGRMSPPAPMSSTPNPKSR